MAVTGTPMSAKEKDRRLKCEERRDERRRIGRYGAAPLPAVDGSGTAGLRPAPLANEPATDEGKGEGGVERRCG